MQLHTAVLSLLLLLLLLVQGFPRPRVVRALLATQSEHMQAALDWILAAGQDPAMDAPLQGDALAAAAAWANTTAVAQDARVSTVYDARWPC